MNKRSLQVLKKLMDDRYHSISSIAEELGVSERLVRYTINDIETYLLSLNIHGMEITRNLGVLIKLDEAEKKLIENKLNCLDTYDIVLSSSQRKMLIYLIMCTSDDFITSQQIADYLNVSKSSIDKDIMTLKNDLKKFDISIISKGSKGSFIDGNERDIRMIMYRVINKNLDFSNFVNEGRKILTPVEKIINEFLFRNNLNSIKSAIKKSEETKCLSFTYQSFKDICVHLSISITRIKLEHKLNEFVEDSSELIKTKGYQFAEIILNDLQNNKVCEFSHTDFIYLGIIINSARYTVLQNSFISDWANIQVIAVSLIKKVSEKLETDLTNDDELLNSLTLHLGPTIFKIKNNIPVVNTNLTIIKREYLETFKVVEEAVKQLKNEDLLGISDDDISYMTLHFCASLERKKQFKNEYNIIIVCVHSIATASLLKEMICTRFKNINVIKTVTRDYLQTVNLNDIDFIVSSIELDSCPLPYIKVNVILKESDVKAIEDLMVRLNDKNKTQKRDIVDEVIKIITEQTNLQDTESIRKELTNYFDEMGIKRYEFLTLADFLSADNVNVIQKVNDLEEAIKTVCRPMLNKFDIEESYIYSILKTIKTVGNYMVIDNGVALVHGEMGLGVNHESMSLLMIEDGVKFNHEKYDPVHMILCLATMSQKVLNKALSNFLKFLEEYERSDKNLYYKKDYLLMQIKKVSNYD